MPSGSLGGWKERAHTMLRMTTAFAVKNRRVKVRRKVKGCVSTCIQPSILR